MKLSTYVENAGPSSARASQPSPCGTLSSRTMIVIRIAMTPSLKASSRPLLMSSPLESRITFLAVQDHPVAEADPGFQVGERRGQAAQLIQREGLPHGQRAVVADVFVGEQREHFGPQVEPRSPQQIVHHESATRHPVELPKSLHQFRVA